MTVAVILWVCFLAWLVSVLYPSQEMRRDTAGNCAYYSLWAIVCGSVLLLQYQMVASSGHVVLAVVSDIIGVSLGAVRLWAMRRCGLGRLSPGDKETAIESLRTRRP